MVYKVNDDELYHHGILGQKWGIRRYQNPDGSLTPAGVERYQKKNYKIVKEYDRLVLRGEKIGKPRDKARKNFNEMLDNAITKEEKKKNFKENAENSMMHDLNL